MGTIYGYNSPQTALLLTIYLLKVPPGIAFKKPIYNNGLARIALEGKLDVPLTGKVLDLTIVAGQMFVTSRHIVARWGRYLAAHLI